MKSFFVIIILFAILGTEAHAQIPSGAAYKIATTCGGQKVLGVSRSSLNDGAPIVLQDPVEGSDSQIFTFVADRNAYLIEAKNSGKVLDVHQALMTPGTMIHQFTFNEGDNQLFRAEGTSDGTWRFQNVNSGLYMNLVRSSKTGVTKLVQSYSSTSCSQRFKLIPLKGSTTVTPTPSPSPAPAPMPVPAPSPAPTTAIGPYGLNAADYVLTFSDEFEGSSLDSSKWTDHIWYDPASSTRDYGVNNGSLKIWPQADQNGQFKERIITTAGHFDQTYGFFEIEAKLPVGSGCWPAFWLLNSDDPNNGEPEIDIMEAYSGDDGGYWADGNHHPIRYEATYFQNGANIPGLQQSFPYATPDLSLAFHRYAVSWEPGTISFYFDGKLIHSASVSMTKRMYILLDMQYGSASGSVDGTTPLGPTNSFEVRYVRAWKHK